MMQTLRSLFPLAVIAISAVICTPFVSAQAASSTSSASAHADATLPDDPSAARAATSTAAQPSTADGQQTKRILGIIPNFRSVSVDAKLPPLSSADKFTLMFQDSFDYSSFIYVGILAGVGQTQKSYPEFHQGAAGYGRYYWHSFADNLGGQITAVERAVTDGDECADILMLLAAIRGGVNSLMAEILEDHIRGCTLRIQTVVRNRPKN